LWEKGGGPEYSDLGEKGSTTVPGRKSSEKERTLDRPDGFWGSRGEGTHKCVRGFGGGKGRKARERKLEKVGERGGPRQRIEFRDFT